MKPVDFLTRLAVGALFEILAIRRFLFRGAESPARRLYVDVSNVHYRVPSAGVGRVVRNISQGLLENNAYFDEVILVHRLRSGQYVQIPEGSFSNVKRGNPASKSQLQEVVFSTGDTLLCLDLVLSARMLQYREIHRLRRLGVTVVCVLYDVIPLTHPHFFHRRKHALFELWLKAATESSGILSISVSSARAFVGECRRRQLTSPHIETIRLGTNLEPTVSESITHRASSSFKSSSLRFILVGTIEPRKQYPQVLQAFQTLWRRGVDASLTIVGRRGWKSRETLRLMEKIARSETRFRWLADAQDPELVREMLQHDALIANSQVEGFGLPVVEAAHLGLKLLVRDTPVFRELCGEKAYFLKSMNAEELGEEIMEWIRRWARGEAPGSSFPEVTWQSTSQQTLAHLEGFTRREGFHSR